MESHPRHSLDRFRGTTGHWLRACDARMSSSSRSSAVNSACSPNGSSGSGTVVSEKLRARLLGGFSKDRDRPGKGCRPPLCSLWLFDAGVPAMSTFSPQHPRTPSTALSAESLRAGPTARAPPFPSVLASSQPAGQSAASYRAQMGDVYRARRYPGQGPACLGSVPIGPG